MIDLHCHLLHGLDDGPATISESIRMISEAEKIGIKEIITTLHLHGHVFKYNDEDICQKFFDLENKTSNFNISVKIGFEVFITSVCKENMNLLVNYTMNNTRFMLVEIPYSEFSLQTFERIQLLRKYRIIPIIAHPERCCAFFKNYNLIESLIDSGCLVQIDAPSILGVYGSSAKYLAKKLIKNKAAHFIASNAHFASDYSEWYERAYYTVKRWAGNEYVKRLFCDNAESIVQCNKNKISKII